MGRGHAVTLDNAANGQVRFHMPGSPAAIDIVSLLTWHMRLHTEDHIDHRHMFVCIYALCFIAPCIYITAVQASYAP